MNNSELIRYIYEPFFPFILTLLFYYGWKILYSDRTSSIKVRGVAEFKKSDTVYQDPPRPNSLNFEKYYYVSLMTTTRRVELVMVISNLIKGNIDLEDENLVNKLSDDVNLLINDPVYWLNQKQEFIESSAVNRKRKKFSRLYLYGELFRALNEIEELTGIPITTHKE